VIPRYRGARLTGGRPPSQRKAPRALEPPLGQSKSLLEGQPRGLLEEQPWLSGRPYYCSTCGASGEEIEACSTSSSGPCDLETKEEAMRRRNRFLQQRERGQ